jgi:hypothetical protein
MKRAKKFSIRGQKAVAIRKSNISLPRLLGAIEMYADFDCLSQRSQYSRALQKA